MHTKGFTLVEVLVSLALFTVVVTMAVGTLLVLIDANSKQQSSQTVVTNVSFALDSMTREIRTGYFYQCEYDDTKLGYKEGNTSTNDCSPAADGASTFAFTESGGSLTGAPLDTDYKGSNRIAYRLKDNAIERRLGDPSNGGVAWTPITAPEVQINELEFIVEGTTSGDTEVPTVTIFISGNAGDIVDLDTTFNLQTTVTQQVLDI